jgi:co-chaperonin GroES (HSP10)
MTEAVKIVSTTDEEFEAQLPKPVGYRVLVALPNVEETFDGSDLIKANATKHHEYVMSIIGLVLDMGDQCYEDNDRFSSAWCTIGDYVMFRANSGTRFIINGKEYRLMNDDSIEAVVTDPRGIQKI